jgi:hypothetical protein
MQTPFYQQPVVDPLATATAEAKPVVEESKSQDSLNEEVRATSNNMIEVLSKSDNPKHRNSKFLKFLKKLAYGAYGIENE